MTDVIFNFRVDQETKERFVAAAKANNRNASLLLRDFMQKYLEENPLPPPAPRRRSAARQAAPANR